MKSIAPIEPPSSSTLAISSPERLSISSVSASTKSEPANGSIVSAAPASQPMICCVLAAILAARCLHVGDPVGKGEGDLLYRRAPLLAEVVAGNRNRVPLRHPLVAVCEQVGRQPDRALGRVYEVPARDVLLEDVVLRGAAQLL